MAGIGYAVMGVMSGYMLSVLKYLASYSRIWRKRIITAQNAKQCLIMSHHLHKIGRQKSGLRKTKDELRYLTRCTFSALAWKEFIIQLFICILRTLRTRARAVSELNASVVLAGQGNKNLVNGNNIQMSEYNLHGINPFKLDKPQLFTFLQAKYEPVCPMWTTERCAVCRWVEDWDYNKIIICNRCQIVVHQECYAVMGDQDLTSWVCRACGTPDVERECWLCPIKRRCFESN